MVRFLPLFAWVVLTIYALVDVVQTDPRRLGGTPKGLWVAGIVLLPFVGALVWLLVGKRRGSPPSSGGRWQDRPGPDGQRPGPPIGPDDDPDFLKSL